MNPKVPSNSSSYKRIRLFKKAARCALVGHVTQATTTIVHFNFGTTTAKTYVFIPKDPEVQVKISTKLSIDNKQPGGTYKTVK